MIRQTITGAALLIFSFLVLCPLQASEQGQEGYAVSGRYIIMFAENVDDPAALADEMARQYGIELDHVYVHVFEGFSAACDQATLTALQNDPRVKYVEQDRVNYPIEPPVAHFIIEIPEIEMPGETPEPEIPEGSMDNIRDLFRLVTPDDDSIRCIGAGTWARCDTDFFESPDGFLPPLIGIRFSDNRVDEQTNFPPFFMWGYSGNREDLFPAQSLKALSPIDILTQKSN